jgi:hypothetical protein
MPRLFSKTVRLEQIPDKPFLRIAIASQQTICRVNGKTAPHVFAPPPERFEREVGPSSGARHLFDLTGLLVPGSNTVELETPFFHGETLTGPVELLEPLKNAPAVRFKQHGLSEYRILHDDQQEDLLLMDNSAGEIGFAGGRTDARHALLTASGDLSLMQATRSTEAGGVTLQSIKPVDIAVQTHHTGVTEIVWDKVQDGDSVTLRKGGVTLRLQTEGGISASFNSPNGEKWILRVRSTDPRFTLVNGRDHGWMTPNLWIEVILSSETGESVDILPESSCYKLTGDLAEEVLIGQVQNGPWVVSLAAADALALQGSQKAGPTLLARLKEELSQPPDPRITHWWRTSKMLHAPGKNTPDTGNDTEQARKQWRLRRALVTSLGLTGYREAVPTLLGMLKEGRAYFALGAQVPVALARLDALECLPELESQWNHPEGNTVIAIRAAARYLRREITRVEFEEKVGPG